MDSGRFCNMVAASAAAANDPEGINAPKIAKKVIL
jgi:hypothetical protein